MILQEEFRNNGYIDLLGVENASEYGIDLADIFGRKPDELLGLFISEQGDELFFLLDGDAGEINSLCDGWDNRIRVFTILNENKESFRKLKYNMMQLVVYSGQTPDKNREGNLMISRKIIIKGDTRDKGRIEIDDDEVIELPFHMIPTDAFAPDEDKIRRLRQLLPEDEDVLSIMKKQQKKVYGKEKDGILDKSFAAKDYDTIRGWLEG